MEPIYAITIGCMTSVAIYLMLSGHFIRFLFGIIIISNAVNLAIFTAGRLGASHPPFIPTGAEAPLHEVANALPQALILTAIVIGFGLLAYSLGLCYRMLVDAGQFDLEAISEDETSTLRDPNEEGEI